MALAICAEIAVLLCLIFTFDGALHSWSSARVTWDHFAVAAVYSYARVGFSKKRLARVSAHREGGTYVPPFRRLPI